MWQGAVRLVCDIMKGVKKVGLMVQGKVVCEVQVLSQVIWDNHALIGIVNMDRMGEFSACDFQLPFLL
jgi:hypothetical protein